MTNTFKRKLKKGIVVLLLGFVLLFIFRLIYGFVGTPNGTITNASNFQNSSVNLRNFASKSYKMEKGGGNSPSNQTAIDQKYEKIAEVRSVSKAFEEEEKETRSKIKLNGGLIQFEQKSGNKGYRRMNLQIGVPPENFDTLYNQLIKIGTIESKKITKNDKTNEYKTLTAKKASLEKIRNSLIELKTKGGKIEEYINLENRILETEQQLQDLGVNLGDFDEENEFCTVKFSLNEGKERNINILQRIKVALEWTVPVYLGMIATCFFIVAFVFIVLVIIERLKILEGIMKK